MRFFLALSLSIAAVSAGFVTDFMSYLPSPPSDEVDGEITGRITNGQEAEEGQFPYQCGLEIQVGNLKAWCGCSIISEDYIVTAAHCADTADNVTVIMGTNNIRETGKTELRVSVPKSNIVVHEGWDRRIIANDIAVMKFPNSIKFNEHIQPITLPKWGTDDTFAGVMAVASGWGKDSDSSKTVSPVLRYIETDVITNFLCNFFYFGNIKPNMVCIDTKGGRSTCNGDSGGPLAVQQDDKPILIGITSFGIAFGCEKNWPGVFTRSTEYLDWIKEKTGVSNE